MNRLAGFFALSGHPRCHDASPNDGSTHRSSRGSDATKPAGSNHAGAGETRQPARGPVIQVAANCPLDTHCFSVQPSITSTGSAQYRPGTRFYALEVRCELGDVYYDGSAVVQWSRNTEDRFGDSKFGGHFSPGKIHPGNPPIGRLSYKGSSAGNVEGPGSASLQVLRFDFAAGDFPAGVRVRFELPEVAGEILMNSEVLCQGPDGPEEFGPFNFRIRTEMDLNLRRVPTLSSTSGRVLLTPQPPADHSHGSFDMHALSDTDAMLRRLVDDYSSCLNSFPNAGSINLSIQAIALVHGGLSDFQQSWRPPHSTHRAGENIDIGFAGFDLITNPNHLQRHYRCFLQATTSAGFTTPVRGERLVEDETGRIVREVVRGVPATHAHLWSGDIHKYSLNQTGLEFNESLP